MRLQLHANATTTPKTRAYIQASAASVAELSRETGVSETTIRRWRARSSVADRSHARHALGQSTTPQHEAIIATLRLQARLSLDDITEVMRRCLAPAPSRSAIWRCLRRLGLNRQPVAAEQPEARPEAQSFAPEPFGYVHVDLKYLGRLKSAPEFVFVAIERVSRFAHIEIIPDRRAQTVTDAMARFLAAFGHHVHTVLTDNGTEFTDRFRDGSKDGHRARPSGSHSFDRLCAKLGITHRLTRPYTPQTNGMAERFNRRLAEAMNALPKARDNSRHTTRFASSETRKAFLLRFVSDYNQTRLRCIAYKAPLEILTNLAKDNTIGGGIRVRANRHCG